MQSTDNAPPHREAHFDALTAELGYELTYADFTGTGDDTELSDSELADVAGGFDPIRDRIDRYVEAGRHIERQVKRW